MKALQGKPQLSGGWDEDINTCIGIFETMANMSDVKDIQRIQALPLMLCGDTLSYFLQTVRYCVSYESAIEMLKKWYKSEEKT